MLLVRQNMSSKSNEVIPLSMRAVNGNSAESFKEEKSIVTVQVDEPHNDLRTVMSFHDINYTVDIPKGFCGACRAKDQKQILTNVRYWLRPMRGNRFVVMFF